MYYLQTGSDIQVFNCWYHLYCGTIMAPYNGGSRFHYADFWFSSHMYDTKRIKSQSRYEKQASQMYHHVTMMILLNGN